MTRFESAMYNTSSTKGDVEDKVKLRHYHAFTIVMRTHAFGYMCEDPFDGSEARRCRILTFGDSGAMPIQGAFVRC